MKYILGDSSFEVKRLAFQAGVWRDMTEDLFDRLGVGPGWRCLEVGAGTGTTLFPLAERVRGRGGRVDAVERSPRYAEYLRRKAARRGFEHVRVLESEILSAALEPGAYDLVFARWVFLFLPDVQAHVRKLAAALRPGGFLAVEDYHRGSMAMYPALSTWDKLVHADRAWFAANGGDVSVAGRLPAAFRRAGLEVTDVRGRLKVGRPGDDVWTWAETYFLTYLPEMSKFPPFTPAVARRFRREWLAAKRGPGSLFVAPAMLDVVGRRPRS